MTARWRLHVDRATCIGVASCAAIAAGRFALDGDRRSVPTQEVIDPDPVVLDAAIACPVEAIRIVEADGGRRVFPEE